MAICQVFSLIAHREDVCFVYMWIQGNQIAGEQVSALAVHTPLLNRIEL